MARRKVIDLDCDSTIKFEKVGQSIEGHFVGSKQIETDFGKSKLHVFKGDEGNFGVYGSSKLDEKLLTVPTGAMTWVTFQGKVSIPGGKTMKKFDVDFDDELIDPDLTGTQINFTNNEEPAEESGEAPAEEAADVDDDTIEAGEAEEEEAPEPKNVAKKPLLKGKPAAAAPTVNAAARANTTSLLNKSKR